jgi:GntR family transcriptional regulator
MPPRRLTYEGIAADLRARIEAGEYPPGSQMPSYSQVAAMYSVSVTTAQAALRMLRFAGLIRTELGRGTFVVGDEDVDDLQTEGDQPPDGG